MHTRDTVLVVKVALQVRFLCESLRAQRTRERTPAVVVGATMDLHVELACEHLVAYVARVASYLSVLFLTHENVRQKRVYTD